MSSMISPETENETPARSTQLAPATALVRLLTEHPELPAATWYVQDDLLYGHLHQAAFDALHPYAELLHGSVCAAPRDHMDAAGRRLRTHWLRSVWGGARVQVAVVVPLASREACLIEQEHQVDEFDASFARLAPAGLAVAA